MVICFDFWVDPNFVQNGKAEENLHISKFYKKCYSISILSDAAKRDDCSDIWHLVIRFDFRVDPNFVQNDETDKNLHNSKFYSQLNLNFYSQR